MKLTLAVVLCMMAAGTTEALQCYYCSSYFQQNCFSYPFSDAGILTCTTDESCFTATTIAGGVTGVVRGCNSTVTPDQCGQFEYEKIYIKVCYCSDNLCNTGRQLPDTINSGRPLQAWVYSFLLVTSAALLFNKIWVPRILAWRPLRALG